MEFKVREATIEDAEAIASVHVESWRSTYDGILPASFIASLNVEERAERWKEEFVKGNFSIFVAEDEGGVFGFVSGGELRPNKDGGLIEGYDGELYAIYLLREHQGRGAGSRLAHTLEDALLSRGLRSMVVWVLKQNPAVSFYQRLGGVQIMETHIEIGGVELPEVAFGWPTLHSFVD
jgi:ribosomal protein S18 acetylase RimI-like enzyme